ncbi:Alpha/beta hydrolase fold-1 [Mycena galericulata]|nr:Alpha/beta hydrolase fold-1 [Mycena galericulata]
MATISTTTFVLVPGSFSTVRGYDKLTPLLAQAGYKYELVPLLSANDGSQFPAPTMQDDAAHIRSQTLALLNQGQNVVLLLHSYAGVPGSEAVQGLGRTDRGPNATAVVGIVYMESYLPTTGDSVRKIMGALMPEEMQQGLPGAYFSFPMELAPFTFNDIDPAEVEQYHEVLCSQSSDAYNGELGQYVAWKDIPSIYISTGKDLIIPLPPQNTMLERAERERGKVTKVFWEDSGHCPNVSRPGKVVEQLIEATKF